MALWTTRIFVKNRQAFILATQSTSYEDDGSNHRLHQAGKEQFSTYPEAVSFLSKLYATNSKIAKTTSKNAALRKTLM